MQSRGRVAGAHIVRVAGVAAVLVAALSLYLRTDSVHPVYAATFTVTAADDIDDGACNASHCSLREAINAANASTGADQITFAIGSGPRTIAPASALPAITGTLAIDASTQPGYAGAPIIELDGSSAGALTDGLTLSSASSSFVRGLVINRFGRHGIRINGGSSNVIAGNYIGTDITGALDHGNGADGIAIQPGVDTTIGGTSAGARNVISGNGGNGVSITSGAVVNRLQGNFIGTNAAGTAAIGNDLAGVLIAADNNVIGGTTSAHRNIISGNGQDGVALTGGFTTQNGIEGNYIGVGANGTTPIGNGHHGVRLDNSIGHNGVGGSSNGSGNRIAYNGRNGVYVQSGNGHPVLTNEIFGNSGLGIDLSDAGGWGQVTPNDPNDTDTGPNFFQNFPVLASALPSGGTIQVAGALDSTPSTTFRIEVYASSSCAGSIGEGEHFLGATNVTTDTNGDVLFSVNLTGTVVNGEYVTATARDGSQNTSEFSSCLVAGIPNTPTPTATPTNTATATNTPTNTPTRTPVPPTATHTPTNTPTVTPTNTPTATPTRTSTPVPPTATSTTTNTAVPPTATHTPPPPTATSTRTSTPVAPTATPTPTRTPSAASATPVKTATPALTKTPPRGKCAAVDVNHDGRITGRDVELIFKAVLRGTYDSRYDVNGDGKLNGYDLAKALKCWDNEHKPAPTPKPKDEDKKPTSTPKPKDEDKKPTSTPKPDHDQPAATPTSKPKGGDKPR